MSENVNISDRAADKLLGEAEAVSKLKGSGYPTGIMRELSGPICSMLVRFCYQEEDFAREGWISIAGSSPDTQSPVTGSSTPTWAVGQADAPRMTSASISWGTR